MGRQRVFATAIAVLCVLEQVLSQQSFSIDYDNNCFVKDGKPFRYISGSLHYFRVPTEYWADRMEKMKAAGLNALQTYVEWSLHEPEPGKYSFEGSADLISFIKTAQQHNLVVILRVGPFIDAERDMGGLPYWLLRENPNMKLRTSDSSYLKYVDNWLQVLLPKIKPLLYANGGPIISVQVENEYGSYAACDFEYTSHLRDTYRKYLGNEALFFTTDGPYNVLCGKISDVYATIDFGPGTDVNSAFHQQRLHQSKGPLVNSEFYPGWLDHWGSPHANVSSDSVCKTLDQILASNASVNIYMFHGGTSFGFTSGANMGTTYQACPTSYDYDAPLSEAGDPTPKYFAMRNIIGKYVTLPGNIPKPSPKMEFGPIALNKVGNLWQALKSSNSTHSTYPLSFEDISHPYGFVLYQTKITFLPSDPAVLKIPGLRDRGYVFVNKNFKGILSRELNIYSMPVDLKNGDDLYIFVENQGRICFGPDINDRKGIVQNITIGSRTLTNWTIIPLSLDVKSLEEINPVFNNMDTNETSGFYSGVFTLPSDNILDTFLRLDGWNKGVAFLNGFNLGRYWPIIGPQVTLYAPAPLFNAPPKTNSLFLFEQEEAPVSATAMFVKDPEINASTPS